MNQIRGTLRLKVMTSIPEVLGRAGLRIFLSGKDENNVAPLVLDRHSIRKGILACRPTYVDPSGLVNPGPGHIKRLVAEDLEHTQQLRLSPFAGLTGDETKNSGHLGTSSNRENQR